MTNEKIIQLTSEQEALIQVYQEKWREIILSTKPINRKTAAETLKVVYKLLDEPEPIILFFDSPYALAKALRENLYHERRNLNRKVASLDTNILVNQIRALSERLEQIFDVPYKLIQDFYLRDLIHQVICCNNFDFVDDYEFKVTHLGIDNLFSECGWYDFCFSEFNFEKYFIGQLCLEIHKHCGPIFAYPDVCLVYDHPCQLLFDEQGHLHAEEKPAIQYIDGFRDYAFHGVRIPEKYGLISPKKWESEWILSERNVELIQVLIQEIGYERICQELQAVELDNWQEYTLLKIESKVDIEPIYLLLVFYPSTGAIHISRVPSDLISTREAIQWVDRWETGGSL